MSQIDLKNATIYLRDGTAGTPNQLEIRIGEGNISFTERVEREYTLDRGRLDEVRNGDEQPMDVSIDFMWEFYRGRAGTGEAPTPIDVLKKQGNAAAWVSSDSDVCRPYAVDVVVVYEPDCGTGLTETVVLPDFRYEELQFDYSEGTISCTGKCNATQAAVTRGS